MLAVCLATCRGSRFCFWNPPGVGWGGSICLGESQSRIYPRMCAKFGCGPTVVSKKRGIQTDRQRDTAALYSRSKFMLSQHQLWNLPHLVVSSRILGLVKLGRHSKYLVCKGNPNLPSVPLTHSSSNTLISVDMLKTCKIAVTQATH